MSKLKFRLAKTIFSPANSSNIANEVFASDNPNETDYVTGSEGKDAFKIDGKSDEFNWDTTLDESRSLVWNDEDHDILWDVGQIAFEDVVVDLV